MIDEFIQQLNQVITTAILHGGDDGGPYYSEPEELDKQIKELLIFIPEKLKVKWDKYKNFPEIIKEGTK